MLRRIAAVCLVLMMICGSAMAEAPFLRYTEDWSLEDVPLEALLSAELISLMPYDEDRLATLSTVTDNLSLRINTGNDEGSVTVLVGKTEVLSVAYLDNAVQISTMPSVNFTSSGNAMDKLLGMTSVTDFSLYGLRGNAETLLDDGWKLLEALKETLEPYGERRSVKTTITDMGTARSCTDYTINKNDIDQLREILLSGCPEGWLKDIIGGLTFSGKQTLRVYRDADEIPLRMEYNGVCGYGEDVRTVKLIWRMRRDDTAHRDEITLTSPAKTGTNKNSLEFDRIIKTDKKGAVQMEGTFTYTVTADKQTTTRKGSFDLTNAFTDESDVISGTVSLQKKMPGEDSYSGMTFEPDMKISGTQDEPTITGTLGVSTTSGKNTLDHARIGFSIRRSEESGWRARDYEIDLDALSSDELAQLQQKVLSGAATALIRPVILLLGDSAEWFFRDMSPEAVQRIIDASGSVVVIE